MGRAFSLGPLQARAPSQSTSWLPLGRHFAALWVLGVNRPHFLTAALSDWLGARNLRAHSPVGDTRDVSCSQCEARTRPSDGHIPVLAPMRGHGMRFAVTRKESGAGDRVWQCKLDGDRSMSDPTSVGCIICCSHLELTFALQQLCATATSALALRGGLSHLLQGQSTCVGQSGATCLCCALRETTRRTFQLDCSPVHRAVEVFTSSKLRP